MTWDIYNSCQVKFALNGSVIASKKIIQMIIIFLSGPGSQSRPPARPLLGQPPALPDPSDDKFSPEQEVCQDEEEFCRNFHQIHMKLD